MADTGATAPGTVDSEGAIGTAWSNPSNAGASDNSYATFSRGTSGNSRYLRAYNFGFAIPVGATINGIAVSVERKADNNSASYNVYDNTIQLCTASLTYSGDNKANASSVYWPTSDGTATYGGAADTWSFSPTVAGINSSDFGVVVRATMFNIDDGLAITASVDAVSITVYYTAATTATFTQRTVVF